MTVKHLCTAIAFGLFVSAAARASTLSLTSSALSTTSLAPSNDTFSLKAGTATTTGTGVVAFQTGTLLIGNSPIANQDILFSFADTITFNGITQTITIFGDDSVSQGIDLLTIHAASPISFGAYTFTLDAASFSGTTVGQSVPLTLSASVAPTPEPDSLFLLGSGALGGLTVLRKRLRQRRQSRPQPANAPGS